MPPLRLFNCSARNHHLTVLGLAWCSLSFTTSSAAWAGSSGCPTFAFAALQDNLGQTHAGSALQQVSFALQAGLLQPQLEQLLQQQFDIEVVDWQVSPHFRWPADYRMHAPSWNELLERLLKPYHLAITLYPNKSAAVRYQSAAGAAL